VILPGAPFQPSLASADKAGAYPAVEYLNGALLVLPADTRRGWEKKLAYYENPYITDKNSFITLGPVE
jgi:hypothetical protein